MIFDLNKKESTIRKFWDLEISNNQNNSFNTLDKYFVDSFSIQQRTDSNLGLNISSGLDSNLMISYLNLINKGQKNISAKNTTFLIRNLTTEMISKKCQNTMDGK